MKRQKGFTLIELMVVIVILGILAAVIAPRIPGLVNKAKEGRTKGNLANLRSAMNIYYSDNDGVYPVASIDADWFHPRYIKAIPLMETAVFPGKTLTHAHKSTAINTAAAVNDDGGWWQQDDRNQADWGDILVNCTGTDSAEKYWTSY